MRIGTETSPRPPLSGRRRSALLIAVGSIGFVAWSVLVFTGGFAWRDFIRPSLQSLTGRTQLSESADAILRAPSRWLAARLGGADVEKIHIDINFRNLHQIHQKRAEALAQGLLVTGSDDLVPAEIRHGDRTVRVKLRLKGDLPDHLEGNKWSFRIQTRGGDAIFGMRRFSIQAPSTRGFQAEPLFLETMRAQGVLALRYFFVDVAVNGRDIGLMAVEEHFAKELLESQGRREGVILKFSESLFWDNVLLNGNHGPYDSYLNAPIEAFHQRKIAKSEALSRDLETATALLRGFVEGGLPASDAFDEELLGRFLAVCEFWAAVHPCRWHNLRFYFNPIDRELEPIGFDGNLQATYLEPGLLTQVEPIDRAFLRDARVADAFVRALRRLSETMEDGSLTAKLREVEATHLRVLHREFPFRAPMDLEWVRRRAFALRGLSAEHLSDFELPGHSPTRKYPALVYAHVIRAEGGRVLEVANALPVPVTLLSARVTGDAVDQQGAAADGSLPGFPITLPRTPLRGQPTWRQVPLPIAAAASDGFLVEGSAVAEGQTQPQAFTAQAYVAPARHPALPHVTAEEVVRRHSFLERTNEAGFLAVRPGTWSVKESVVLPEGVGLRAGAGTRLRFGNDVVLVARGPLDFRGAEARPIVLEAAQPGTTWPGLVVLNAGAESHWSHVEVRSTSGFRLGNWGLTGAVTFYASDARLEHCRLADNRGEDALNVVNSRFAFDDVSIRNTASDAFDGDFTEGEIRGGYYEHIGGDGIDLSGSRVTIDGTSLREVRDKAVSIGEASRVEARNLRIERAGTGVVAKDLSEGDIRDSQLRDIQHIALMAYVKKREYGPGELRVENVSVVGAEGLALAQVGSRISIDGEPVTEQPFDAEAVYKEGYMRK